MGESEGATEGRFDGWFDSVGSLDGWFDSDGWFEGPRVVALDGLEDGDRRNDESEVDDAPFASGSAASWPSDERRKNTVATPNTTANNHEARTTHNIFRVRWFRRRP